MPSVAACMPQLGQATPSCRNLVSLQAVPVDQPAPSSACSNAPIEGRGMAEMVPQPGCMLGQVTPEMA